MYNVTLTSAVPLSDVPATQKLYTLLLFHVAHAQSVSRSPLLALDYLTMIVQLLLIVLLQKYYRLMFGRFYIIVIVE